MIDLLTYFTQIGDSSAKRRSRLHPDQRQQDVLRQELASRTMHAGTTLFILVSLVKMDISFEKIN